MLRNIVMKVAFCFIIIYYLQVQFLFYLYIYFWDVKWTTSAHSIELSRLCFHKGLAVCILQLHYFFADQAVRISVVGNVESLNIWFSLTFICQNDLSSVMIEIPALCALLSLLGPIILWCPFSLFHFLHFLL